MTLFDALVTAGFALFYLAALVLVFRHFIEKGVVFTPLLVANVLLFVLVAPSFFFAYRLGISENPYALLVFMTGFVFLTLGHMCNVKVRILPRPVPEFRSERELRGAARADALAAIALAAVLTGLGLLFYGGLPSTVTSMGFILSGDSSALPELAREVRLERLALTKGAYFGGEDRAQGLNTTVQSVGWSILIAYTSALVALRSGTASVIAFGATIVLAWIFVAGTGTRAPFLLAALTGVIAYSIVRPFPVKRLLALFAGMILLAIFLGSYSHKMSYIFTDLDANLLIAFQEIFNRFLFGNGWADVQAIELSRAGTLQSDFGQYHARNFISALPGVQGGLPLAYHLTQLLGGGRTTFLTGTYISTVYVDFGILGVALVFFLIGLTLKFVQVNVFPVRRTAWAIAIASITICNMTEVVKGGYHALIAAFVVTGALLLFHRVVADAILLGFGWSAPPSRPQSTP